MHQQGPWKDQVKTFNAPRRAEPANDSNAMNKPVSSAPSTMYPKPSAVRTQVRVDKYNDVDLDNLRNEIAGAAFSQEFLKSGDAPSKCDRNPQKTDVYDEDTDKKSFGSTSLRTASVFGNVNPKIASRRKSRHEHDAKSNRDMVKGPIFKSLPPSQAAKPHDNNNATPQAILPAGFGPDVRPASARWHIKHADTKDFNLILEKKKEAVKKLKHKSGDDESSVSSRISVTAKTSPTTGSESNYECETKDNTDEPYPTVTPVAVPSGNNFPIMSSDKTRGEDNKALYSSSSDNESSEIAEPTKSLMLKKGYTLQEVCVTSRRIISPDIANIGKSLKFNHDDDTNKMQLTSGGAMTVDNQIHGENLKKGVTLIEQDNTNKTGNITGNMVIARSQKSMPQKVTDALQGALKLQRMKTCKTEIEYVATADLSYSSSDDL